jgi:hypothetical protein
MHQHCWVSAADYFLPKAADEADLSQWASILPPVRRILRTSLFGDTFVVCEDGAVNMLERASCAAERIASSEEAFWRDVQDDPHGWQLRRLADECRDAGKVLCDGQCYAFTTPPVLGGEYAVANVWVAPWGEWFDLTADLFRQIKDLPDGATVRFKIVD